MRSLLPSLLLSCLLPLVAACPANDDDSAVANDDDAANDDDLANDDDVADDDDLADDDDVANDDDVADDDDSAGPCRTVTGTVDFAGSPPTGITPGPLAVGAFAPGDVMNGLPDGEPFSGTEASNPTFPLAFEICAPPAGAAAFLAIYDVNDGMICTPGDLHGSLEVVVPASGPFDVGTIVLSEVVGQDGCRREEPPA